MKSNSHTSLYLCATQCRVCFEKFGLEPPIIDIAQPRWVGPNYWDSSKRIVIVQINPGTGEGQKFKKEKNREFLPLLYGFRDGTVSLDELFRHQKTSMAYWGTPRGRFLNYYIEGLGLNLDDIAFGNIAWCAVAGNKHPKAMLRECFSRHTSGLLILLDPQFVLLAGTETHTFVHPIMEMLPRAKIIMMLHHAHREGKEATRLELERVRDIIGTTVK